MPVCGPYFGKVHLKVEAWEGKNTPSDVCLECALTGVLTLGWRMDAETVIRAIDGMQNAIRAVREDKRDEA